MKRVCVLLSVPLALVFGGCPQPSEPISPDYSAEQVELDVVEPNASALNNAGEVAGSVMIAPEILQPAVWSDGDADLLPDPDNRTAVATAISELGAVAGTSTENGDSSDDAKVTIWTYDDPDVADDLEGSHEAFAVNSLFEVVGSMQDDESDETHPVLWMPLDLKLNAKPLETVDDLGGIAYDINDVGIAVGYSRNNTGPMDATAVQWTVRGIDEIGGLGGDFSAATAINDFGAVVGYGTLATGPSDVFHAWFAGANGASVDDIGTLGGASSMARDINDTGAIVGWSINGVAARRATLWVFSIRQGEYVPVDLNDRIVSDDLDVTYEDALDINDAGQILVEGRLEDDTVVYSLLTP